MSIRNKIEQIEQAIQKAIKRESKLSKEALEVPSFTSLNIRHLLNNLGAISTSYLDCGSHKGGSFCSAVYANDNLKCAVSIDNYGEFSKGGETRLEFLKNAQTFSPKGMDWHSIEQDCFTVKAFPCKFDMYLYDAIHSESGQQRAVSCFLEWLTDEYIFLVDDWSFDGVERGTRNGIKLSGVEVLYEKILETPEGVAHNEAWHNSFAVFYLRQK